MCFALDVRPLIMSGKVSIGDDEEVPLGVGDPFLVGGLRGSSQVRIEEVGGVLLVADVLVDPCFICEDKGAEGELQLLGCSSVAQYKLKQLAEQHSHLLFLLVPPGNILRHLSPLRFVLLVQSSEAGVDKLALSWLLLP